MYKKYKSLIWLIVFAIVAVVGFWFYWADGWVGGLAVFGVIWQIYHIVPVSKPMR